MANIWRLITKLWWLALAVIPFIFWQHISSLYKEIGCTPNSDCYNPGTIAAYQLEILVIGIAILVWPICFWHLGGKWLFERIFK
jgi:hypothetical protein